MKSREYRNTQNGLVYWLEDGKVMMRKPGYDYIVKQSHMTAAEFFVAVGTDVLVLVEGE